MKKPVQRGTFKNFWKFEPPTSHSNPLARGKFSTSQGVGIRTPCFPSWNGNRTPLLSNKLHIRRISGIRTPHKSGKYWALVRPNSVNLKRCASERHGFFYQKQTVKKLETDDQKRPYLFLINFGHRQKQTSKTRRPPHEIENYDRELKRDLVQNLPDARRPQGKTEAKWVRVRR